jgi:hypothetical protein
LLTVYARAAHHATIDGRLDEALTGLCTCHPETLALPANEVIPQLEAPGTLIDALRTLTS